MKKYNYIYKITNTTNGKIYIGKHSTDNLYDNYMGSGHYLKNAQKKYGIENFKKDYLAFCDTEDKLNWFEKYYIKKYKSNDLLIGYNLTDGGEAGWHHTEETKKKISEAGKGRYLSEETKKKISEKNKGENNGMYGKIISEKTKAKMSEAQKGDKNNFYGKTHTAESKEKMSNAKKGKKLSAETKEKISSTSKGHKLSDKTKEKMKIYQNKKCKYITPTGEIKEMRCCSATRFHPDWIKISE